MEEFFRLAHKNTCKPANYVYIVYKSKMHVYRTMKMHASCMMMMDRYILLKNLKFQQRMKCLTSIFSWLISGGNLVLLVFWNKFLIQDLEHRNSYKMDCNFSNSYLVLHMLLMQDVEHQNSCKTGCIFSISYYDLHMVNDNGRIHSAEEFKVPVKNEMYYSDFQLANIRQPPPPVLTQDVECQNSRKMGCILPIHRTLFICW
ncbi:uncharacterized protein LOC142528917 isoform X1 [Primulina tabacum]|uniref:uncharacterized protein LOC142528917 isoform X1 n=1 Tax=Primulina tabacum TaxID=48773 RepID=UPI003F5A388A